MNQTSPHVIPYHRHLKKITDTLHLGVLVLNEALEPELVSEEALNLLGEASLDALRERWPALREGFVKALACVEETRRPGQSLTLHDPAQEAPRKLRLDIHRIKENQASSYLIIVRDQAHLAALDADLQLATRSRSMSRLHRALGHDVKTPLNAITINLDLLKTMLSKTPPVDPVLNDRQQRYLRVLTDELNRLTRALQTFITQTVPPPEPTEQTFDLRDLILDLISLIAPQSNHQLVAVEAQLAEDTMLVEGQRELLKQALLNVAVNALEFMPGGGRLHIRLENRVDQAAIIFEDTGPGIPPEHADRIWEMHYSTQPTGTGIGLYVTRAVIDTFGGSIVQETQPGHGACFTIMLPITRKEV